MLKPGTLMVTEDFTKQFNDIISRFKHDEVLVGIPDNEANRKDDDTGITNAALLAINNFGSPANNIPARPVMEIGIKNAQNAIADEYKNALKEALNKGIPGLQKYYNRVGVLASQSIKAAINSQEGIAPLAPATIAAREAQGFKGTKALIRTGQMRNAITYVVRSKV